eukprot:m.159107 g.159107  ORF g.159107 m.159107 type:complete len:1241 (+) comp31120_c0_seq2:330-4052(+)
MATCNLPLLLIFFALMWMSETNASIPDVLCTLSTQPSTETTLNCGGAAEVIVHRGNVDNSNVLCCVPCSGGGTCASDLTADVDIAILQSLSDVQIKSILKQNLRLNSQSRLIIKETTGSLDLPNLLDGLVIPSGGWLVFRDTTLTTIPADLLGSATISSQNTGVVFDHNSQLTSVAQGAFAGLQLQVFALKNSPLLKFPCDTFTIDSLTNPAPSPLDGLTMSSFGSVHLEDNQLVCLPRSIFSKGFSNVNSIFLRGNNFSSSKTLPRFGKPGVDPNAENAFGKAKLYPTNFLQSFGNTAVTILDVSNSGSWLKLDGDRAMLDMLFGNLPKFVQVVISHYSDGKTTIGPCCSRLTLIQNAHQTYVLPPNLVCSHNTSVYDVNTIRSNTTLVRELCSCVDTLALEALNLKYQTTEITRTLVDPQCNATSISNMTTTESTTINATNETTSPTTSPTSTPTMECIVSVNTTTIETVVNATTLRMMVEECETVGPMLRSPEGQCISPTPGRGIECPIGHSPGRIGLLPAVRCLNISSVNDYLTQLETWDLSFSGVSSGIEIGSGLAWVEDFECIMCLVNNCASCPAAYWNCVECMPGLVLLVVHGEQLCVESCPANNYINHVANPMNASAEVASCEPCDVSTNCKICAGDKCLLCTNDTYIFNSTCHTTLPSSKQLSVCTTEQTAPLIECNGTALSKLSFECARLPNTNPSCNLSALATTLGQNGCVQDNVTIGRPFCLTPVTESMDNGGVIAASFAMFAILGLCAGAVGWNYFNNKKSSKLMLQLNYQANLIDGFENTLDEWRDAWAIDYCDITITEKVAEGAFGEVWKGVWMDIDVAVKWPKVTDTSEFEYIDTMAREDFTKEADFVSKIHHANVIGFYGVGLLPTDTVKKPFIVMEWMGLGSLQHHLSSDNEFPWKRRIQAAADIARGMKYLHSKDCLHRDLKSANCLINHNCVVKVADFGSSKRLENMVLIPGEILDSSFDEQDTNVALNLSFNPETECQGSMTKGIGTMLWMAPEILDGSTHYGKASDVYSYGIILWELLTRRLPWDEIQSKPPFFSTDLLSAVTSGKRPDIPDSCPDDYRELVKMCWDSDAEVRPPFAMVTLSDMFQGVEQETAPIFSRRSSSHRSRHYSRAANYIHSTQHPEKDFFGATAAPRTVSRSSAPRNGSRTSGRHRHASNSSQPLLPTKLVTKDRSETLRETSPPPDIYESQSSLLDDSVDLRVRELASMSGKHTRLSSSDL